MKLSKLTGATANATSSTYFGANNELILTRNRPIYTYPELRAAKGAGILLLPEKEPFNEANVRLARQLVRGLRQTATRCQVVGARSAPGTRAAEYHF